MNTVLNVLLAGEFLYICLAIPKLADNVFKSQIGFYVVECGSSSRRWIGPVDKDKKLKQNTPFVTTWQVCILLDVSSVDIEHLISVVILVQVSCELQNPERLMIIPTTMDPHVEYSFTLDIFSDTGCSIAPVSLDQIRVLSSSAVRCRSTRSRTGQRSLKKVYSRV